TRSSRCSGRCPRSLFIIWLGIGEMPKEVLIMIGVIPIVAVTTVAALDEVPDDLRLCARTLGASPRYTMLRVQIRSALPGILTGMRISMAGAWTSIVAAELIAATSGLGYLIMRAGPGRLPARPAPAGRPEPAALRALGGRVTPGSRRG